jgi:hypothetical protein
MGWSGWATTSSLVAIGAVALGVEAAVGGVTYAAVWTWAEVALRAPQADSATANATAVSRPWVSETWTRSTPSCTARAA